jgi:hypothetical protein
MSPTNLQKSMANYSINDSNFGAGHYFLYLPPLLFLTTRKMPGGAAEQFGTVCDTPKESDGLACGIFFFARRSSSEAANSVN